MTDDRVGSTDPTTVETLVVHAEDVVTAYEARARNDKRAVLRVTPPFSARMRARIHIHQPGEYDGQEGLRPIHVLPSRLLDDDRPSYPEPDETAADLDGPPDPETHHEHHREAVAAWRERTREHVRDSITVEHAGETLEMRVAVLRRSE